MTEINSVCNWMLRQSIQPPAPCPSWTNIYSTQPKSKSQALILCVHVHHYYLKFLRSLKKQTNLEENNMLDPNFISRGLIPHPKGLVIPDKNYSLHIYDLKNRVPIVSIISPTYEFLYVVNHKDHGWDLS